MTPTPDITLGVSLYSYGGDFLVTMSLEDCVADVADMGAADIEILADTHIPGYPAPTTAWIDSWLDLVDGAGLTPTCYSSWLDTRLHKGRDLTVDEGVPILLRDLELAHRLGFSIVRPKLGVVSLDLIPDPVWRETVERVLPRAAELGIRIAPEIHSPTPLKSKIVDDYVDLVRDTGTEHFGLLIDTGIFQMGERSGDGHSDSVYAFGNPSPELREQVAREMSKPLAVPAGDLLDLMPYVIHVHAKFWDMTDDLTDPHIPYDGVVDALVRGGYRGSLSGEYEGPRDLYRASDVLRRQQLMLRRLLGGVLTSAPASAIIESEC
jgi:sugar phosphate isomerase/epimerase